ncbi:MAG: DUF4837 family protein [Candidatus Eisenbacteria bacterium]|nr:DUF4837 family protein [Candidatus Eisenbacteria bacterium]
MVEGRVPMSTPCRLFLAPMLLAALVLGLGGCTRSFVTAVGPNEDVSIFSDFPQGDTRTDLVRDFLVRKRPAPVRPESYFDVDRGDSTVFRQRRDWRTLLILGDMSGARGGARLCSEVLGEEARARLAGRPAGYAFASNVWADGQTVLFVHAPDTEALRALLSRDGPELIAELGDRIVRGLQRTLYVGGEQRQLADGIAERHGYRLRIPKDFFVEEQVESRFVRLKKVPPDQGALFLFVYYQEQTHERLDPRLCMAIRDTLAAAYFAGDEIEPSRTTTRTIEFLGREALEIHGLYQNDDPPMGGPFKMFCFHDRGRLYVIDLAVFNPPEAKTPDLRVLEAIARTFQVVDAP